jgi:CelD/BcsL family acetyltransferase involved in cellulose biosynthesis
MKITVLPANRLTAAHLEAWTRLQEADPVVDSPYFRPEFTRAVAAVRADVEVAVLEEDGAVAGFFPFQRGRWDVGSPVGGRMSDFHGVIARAGLEWEAEALVRACGLRGWDFDHVPAAQAAFLPHSVATAGSGYIDLTDGFGAYAEDRNQPGHHSLRNTLRKARKLAREVGPLRFEWHTADPAVWAALLEWKRAQYQRTGATDIFAFGWTTDLLQRVLAESGEGFAGLLAALYAGDRLAAVHLGLRAHGVMHGWFPAYNMDLAAYSPGLVLLVELLKVAADSGVRRFDFGKGEKDHKTCFMSGAIALAEGCVAPSPVLRLLRHGWRQARAWVKTSPLRAPAQLAGRLTRPLRGWLAFR